MADGTVRCIDSEIPFAIPESWEWVRLKAIGITETGTTPSKEHPEYFGNFIPFLGPSNIQNNTIASVSQGLSKQGMTHGRIVPPNTILQVCIGGSIGKCAIINEPVSFNQQINSVTPILCNTNYIFYNLQSDVFKTQIIESSTGTATPIINRSNWESILIPIPPIEEQLRIAIKVEMLQPLIAKYDAAEKQLTSLNAVLNQVIKKSILQEAIQGRLVPQIASEGTAEELLAEIRAEKQQLVKEGKLKKSAIANESRIFRGEDNRYYEQIGNSTVDITEELPFEIPVSWSWCRLGNLANLHIGKTPPRGEPIFWSNGKWPWVSISDIEDGATLTETKEMVSDEAVKQVFKGNLSPKGSLIMSFKLTIGKVAILGVDAFHNEAIITVQPYNNSNSLLQYLKRVLPIFAQMGDSKDAIKGKTLNSTSLANLFIPLPPIMEQGRIENRLIELFQKLK